MLIPTGIPGTDFTVNGIPFITAINMKEIRIFEGRFEINPPIFVPSRSASTVARAIHIPATKKERTIRRKNILSKGKTLFKIHKTIQKYSQNGSGTAIVYLLYSIQLKTQQKSLILEIIEYDFLVILSFDKPQPLFLLSGW